MEKSKSDEKTKWPCELLKQINFHSRKKPNTEEKLLEGESQLNRAKIPDAQEKDHRAGSSQNGPIFHVEKKESKKELQRRGIRMAT